MIPAPYRLYAALGVGALIVALVAWAMIVTGQRNTAREQVKNEKLSHSITRASLKGAIDALRDVGEKVREIDRLGQERTRNATAALKEAEREAEKLRGPLERLRASAAAVRPPGAPCVPSDAVRAIEGEL